MEERERRKHQAYHSHNGQHPSGQQHRRPNPNHRRPVKKQRPVKEKKPIDKNKVFNILSLVFAGLAHIAFILIIVWSVKFSGIDIKSFIFLYIVLALLLIINDVILLVGFKYKDFLIKCVATGLAIILLVVGVFGSSIVGRVSGVTGKVIQNDSKEQYETVDVSFVTYDNSSITSLSDLNGKKVGVTKSSSSNEDTTSVGKKKLESENVSVSYTEYDSLADTFMGLITGEVNAAILPASFEALLKQNSGYDKYLEKTTVVETVSENVKTGESSGYNKDLTLEPFTVLLIGYAQESENYGLADSVILCSVNPLTYQVAMVSLARDSYVPICGGGSDKLTHARGQSRACLIQTVEDLMDEKVDFYMEINFQGVVDVVDALGGVVINNPVEFVGQSPSIERGNMTVWVPAGEFRASGEQALAFARERHAYAAGDFARQQHQQEVIKAIAEEIFNLNDVNKALAVLDAAGKNFTTNFSMSQITSLLNYVLTHGRNTGVYTINQMQIFNSRVTGYSSWHWSESAQLALWIYRLWNGSIKDNKWLIDKVMGLVDVHDQYSKLTFSWNSPYSESYSFPDTYNEEEIHEQLPTTVPDLVGMTLAQAQAWASTAGVDLRVNYVATQETKLEGIVKAQSPSSGTSIDDCGRIVTVDVYKVKAEELTVPTYTTAEEYISWANQNGIVVANGTISTQDSTLDGKFANKTSPEAGATIEKGATLTIYYYKYDPSTTVTVPQFSSAADVQTWANNNGMGFAIGTTPVTEGHQVGDYAGTNPPAGSTMSKGDTITALTYAAETITVPTFTSVEEVQTWANNNGMGFAEGTTIVTEGHQIGEYAGTNPPAGSTMNKGDTITALTYAGLQTSMTHKEYNYLDKNLLYLYLKSIL